MRLEPLTQVKLGNYSNCAKYSLPLSRMLGKCVIDVGYVVVFVFVPVWIYPVVLLRYTFWYSFECFICQLE